MTRRTKFSLWLMRRQLTNALFADRMALELRFAVHADSVANWREGRSLPRGRRMAAIEKLTGGEITDAVLSADLKARRRS